MNLSWDFMKSIAERESVKEVLSEFLKESTLKVNGADALLVLHIVSAYTSCDGNHGGPACGDPDCFANQKPDDAKIRMQLKRAVNAMRTLCNVDTKEDIDAMLLAMCAMPGDLNDRIAVIATLELLKELME
ncbi:hypothetical protein ACK0NM_22195 [Pseudomonas aeruginosa]|uniref:hypothetical protein n=1 Tax=Pseudomonas aeruginosa TaxID=287 RepID=UPI00390819B2